MKLNRTLIALTLVTLFTGSLLGQDDNTDKDDTKKSRRSEKGTKFVGLNNYVRHSLNGAQLGLSSNRVRGDFTGVQLAGLANVVQGDANGLQFAFLANVIEEDSKAAQLSGLASVTGQDAALQISGMASVAGQNSGYQFGGLAAVTGGAALIGQTALMATVAGAGAPVQLAGIAAVAAGERSLIQMAGVAAVSEVGALFQLGGVAAVSGDMAGVQVGFVSVAPSALVQVGFLNISESSLLPIGVINIVGDNPIRMFTGIDGHGQATAAIRSGNDYFYTVVGFQGGEDATVARLSNLLAGFGVMQSFRDVYVSAEYLMNQRYDTFNNLNTTLGLRLGYRLSNTIGISAGLATDWNAMVNDSNFDGLSSGWSIGLEWYRWADIDMNDMNDDWGDWN